MKKTIKRKMQRLALKAIFYTITFTLTNLALYYAFCNCITVYN